MKENTQTAIIVLICIILIAVLFAFSIKLMINQEKIEKNETYNKENQSIVSEIIDGDTFKLKSGEIIRLICVDTPEKGKSGYNEAKIFLSENILYKANITFEGNTTDNYNRSLKWVYVDDVLLNKLVVGGGYGVVFEYGETNCSRLKE